MNLSDNTIAAEVLSRLVKKLRRRSAKSGRRISTNMMKSLGRASKSGAKIGKAAVSETPKQIYLLYQMS